jgi:hypothetical protein
MAISPVSVCRVSASVAAFAMSAAWLGGQGSIVVALSVVLAGTWLGLEFYGRLDEAQFRKLVLILLLARPAPCCCFVRGTKLRAV